MERAFPLLGPFAELTTKRQSETACISQVIPITKYLFLNLDHRREREMTHGVCQMKIKLKTELRKYLRGENTRQHFPSIEVRGHTDVFFCNAA